MIREPLEQHFDVDVIAMQIMKMDHIRLNVFKSSKKTFRSVFTMKSRFTIYASLKHVELNLCIRGKLHFVRFFRLTASTPERI